MKKIHIGWFKIGENERRAVNEVLDSWRISEGPKIMEFERDFSQNSLGLNIQL